MIINGLTLAIAGTCNFMCKSRRFTSIIYNLDRSRAIGPEALGPARLHRDPLVASHCAGLNPQSLFAIAHIYPTSTKTASEGKRDLIIHQTEAIDLVPIALCITFKGFSKELPTIPEFVAASEEARHSKDSLRFRRSLLLLSR
jgi:hypothetical protein